MRFVFLAGAALAVALGACERRPGTPEPEGFVWGVAAGLSPEAVRATRALGAASLRGDFPWSQFEPERGRYVVPPGVPALLDEARVRGVAPLGLLLYGNAAYDAGLFPVSPEARRAYGRYADFAVERLPGVRLWEIWNEWNLPVGMPPGTPPGDPAAYVTLLAETYAGLKPRFPEKVFLGGAVAGIGRKDDWTKRALDAGMLGHLDGFSFHPYVYWMPGLRRLPERGLVDLVAELEALLARYPGGDRVPLYITEFGWPTHEAPDGVTLDEQAKYLARSMLLLRANPRIRGVWLYTLFDRAEDEEDAWDRESNFGLLFADGSPKPAWFAVRDTLQLLRGVQGCERLDFGPENHAVAGVALRQGNQRRLVVWTILPGETYRVTLRSPGPRLRGTVGARSLGGGVGPRLAPDGATGEVSVTITDSPLVLDGAAEILSVAPVRINEILPGREGEN